MKFSIVIPVYNKEDCLKTTLQSVLDQRFGNFEILIIDDGSSDSSVSIIKEFSDPRMRLISQKNSGVSIARNRGIEESTGEWICFLDADDWYHPEYLQALNKTLIDHQNIAVMAARFVPMPDSPNWAPGAWELGPNEYELIENLPKRWLQGIPFFTSSIAVKRNLLLSMQPCFPPGESSGEDLDLWFRLAEKEPILLLSQPLSAYRTNVRTGLSALAHSTLNLPYLMRMVKRSPSLSPSLRHASLRYVTQIRITEARMLISSGLRLEAVKLLINIGLRGIFIKRWWVSIFLAFCIPAHLAHKLQAHREKRALIDPNSLKLRQR